jgi:hypothetical protein
LLNHAFEIGIACAKAPGEPVSTALGYFLSISQDFKLTCFTWRNHSFSAKPLLNEVHETRDLGFIVLSRWAGTYLNFHSVLQICFGVAVFVWCLKG